MGKKSVRENKSIYQISRENAGLTRAQASETIGFLSESRIEKIESGGVQAHPEDVLAMAEAYMKPELCNYYCTHECRIGIEHIPEVKSKGLSQIVLGMLATLNTLNREKDRLIEITEDEVISDDELPDFVRIQTELEKISLTVETLKLWVRNTIVSGGIDPKKLEQIRKSTEL